jgi:Tol biopolymer transport system component
VTDAPTGRGGAWNRQGTILFAPRSGSVLHTVSAGGGASTPLSELAGSQDQTGGHRYPKFHPDGRHFVYYVAGKGIYAGSLDSTQSKEVLTTNSTAAFAPDGSLLYVNGDTLMAQKFDVNLMELTGSPMPVAEKVARYDPWGFADFSVSDNGVIAYRTGGFWETQLTWVDRQGNRLGVVGEPENYSERFRLSPDGKRAAVVRLDPQAGTYNIWLVELSTGIASRLTPDPHKTDLPVWSPTGDQIAFSSDRNGNSDLYLKTLSTGQEEVLLRTGDNLWAHDWSRGGELFTYGSLAQGSFDLWLLELKNGRKPRPFLQTSFTEVEASFSPDGRWLAYHSNESGKPEMYVRPVEGPGERIRISADGSNDAQTVRWRGDGRELFYTASDGTMMAVPIDSGGSQEFGAPKKLFKSNPNEVLINTLFDVTSDGQRFLILSSPSRRDSALMTVVFNWPRALKSTGK